MNDDTHHPAPEGATTTATARQCEAPPVLDTSKYRGHLAALALSREQEDELLAIVWEMMRAFVDLGFGMDSVSPLGSVGAQNTSRQGPPSLQLDERNAVRERFRAVTDQGKEVPE